MTTYNTDRVVETLVTLSEVDPKYSELALSISDQYLKRGGISPKQMAIIAWRLKIRSVEHDPEWFYVDIDSLQRKADLLSMSQLKINTVYPYLTRVQRMWLSCSFEPSESIIPMEVI